MRNVQRISACWTSTSELQAITGCNKQSHAPPLSVAVVIATSPASRAARSVPRHDPASWHRPNNPPTPSLPGTHSHITHLYGVLVADGIFSQEIKADVVWRDALHVVNLKQGAGSKAQGAGRGTARKL